MWNLAMSEIKHPILKGLVQGKVNGFYFYYKGADSDFYTNWGPKLTNWLDGFSPRWTSRAEKVLKTN